MRLVKTRVFPEPAPARISADLGSAVTAWACCLLSDSVMDCILFFSSKGVRSLANASARCRPSDERLLLHKGKSHL